jgi:hypothetical protein
MPGVKGKVAIAGALGALAGCSLLLDVDGLVGTAPGGSEAGVPDGSNEGAVVVPGDGGSSDAPFLQDVPVNPVDGCALGGCFDMPSGFALVAFGTKGAACPGGFGPGADSVEGPRVDAGACTCACTVTAQPSCAQGQVVGFYGTGGALTCPNSGSTYANNGCGTDGFLGPFGAGNEHRFTPPPASGGTCSAAAEKDNSKLSYVAEARVCQATLVPQCDGKVCLPSVAPFQACIATAGDVACPAPFTTKHLVGSGASFNCSSSCTCGGVTATCRGRVDYYASGNCSGAVGYSVPVTNQCLSTNNDGGSYASHLYVANAPLNVACTSGGSATPSAPALNQITTVCCN